jgi:hypothetical protein
MRGAMKNREGEAFALASPWPAGTWWVLAFPILVTIEFLHSFREMGGEVKVRRFVPWTGMQNGTGIGSQS